MKYKIRFTRAVIENLAPKSGGGYIKSTIPRGTERVVNLASYNFWIRRDCIELVEKIDDKQPISSTLNEQIDILKTQNEALLKRLKELEAPQIDNTTDKSKASKTQVRQRIEEARQALSSGDLLRLRKSLSELVGTEDVFVDLADDLRQALLYFIEDAEAGVDITQHLEGAEGLLRDAYIALLPPSQRSRYK